MVSQIYLNKLALICIITRDRGEMLAAAIACLYLGIKTAHIHGGEVSGTVDESIRHAITKIASVHFAATEKAKSV